MHKKSFDEIEMANNPADSHSEYGTIIKTTPFAEIYLPHHKEATLKTENLNKQFGRVEDLLQKLQSEIALVHSQQELQGQNIDTKLQESSKVEEQLSTSLNNIHKDIYDLKENMQMMQGSLEQVEEQLDEWEKFILQQEANFGSYSASLVSGTQKTTGREQTQKKNETNFSHEDSLSEQIVLAEESEQELKAEELEAEAFASRQFFSDQPEEENAIALSQPLLDEAKAKPNPDENLQIIDFDYINKDDSPVENFDDWEHSSWDDIIFAATGKPPVETLEGEEEEDATAEAALREALRYRPEANISKGNPSELSETTSSFISMPISTLTQRDNAPHLSKNTAEDSLPLENKPVRSSLESINEHTKVSNRPHTGIQSLLQIPDNPFEIPGIDTSVYMKTASSSEPKETQLEGQAETESTDEDTTEDSANASTPEALGAAETPEAWDVQSEPNELEPKTKQDSESLPLTDTILMMEDPINLIATEDEIPELSRIEVDKGIPVLNIDIQNESQNKTGKPVDVDELLLNENEEFSILLNEE